MINGTSDGNDMIEYFWVILLNPCNLTPLAWEIVLLSTVSVISYAGIDEDAT